MNCMSALWAFKKALEPTVLNVTCVNDVYGNTVHQRFPNRVDKVEHLSAVFECIAARTTKLYHF